MKEGEANQIESTRTARVVCFLPPLPLSVFICVHLWFRSFFCFLRACVRLWIFSLILFSNILAGTYAH
jgi:hypothetical protein